MSGIQRESCPHCQRPMPRKEMGPWGKARKASGLSVRDAAARTGISASTVNRVDYDASALALGHAERLAEVYGVTVGDMLAAPAVKQ